MSESSAPTVPPQSANPMKSPTYPQRIHVAERPALRTLLADAEARIAAAHQQYQTLLPGPKRDTCTFLLAQLAGARDQLADAVRRLPMEAGDLYAEDKHLLDNAAAALERVLVRWDAEIVG